MREQGFSKFLDNVLAQLPVSMIAKKAGIEEGEKCVKVAGSLPAFEAMDLLENNDCLVLKDGRVVKKTFLLKRPLRIAFFIILTELESKLYRIQEERGWPSKELNEKNLNDFIRTIVEDEKVVSLQKEYDERKIMREDLKAASSFRNLIVHVNRKLEMETSFETAIKRKRQMLKLVKALNQILDGLYKERQNEKKN